MATTGHKPHAATPETEETLPAAEDSALAAAEYPADMITTAVAAAPELDYADPQALAEVSFVGIGSRQPDGRTVMGEPVLAFAMGEPMDVPVNQNFVNYALTTGDLLPAEISGTGCGKIGAAAYVPISRAADQRYNDAFWSQVYCSNLIDEKPSLARSYISEILVGAPREDLEEVPLVTRELVAARIGRDLSASFKSMEIAKPAAEHADFGETVAWVRAEALDGPGGPGKVTGPGPSEAFAAVTTCTFDPLIDMIHGKAAEYVMAQAAPEEVEGLAVTVRTRERLRSTVPGMALSMAA